MSFFKIIYELPTKQRVTTRVFADNHILARRVITDMYPSAVILSVELEIYNASGT